MTRATFRQGLCFEIQKKCKRLGWTELDLAENQTELGYLLGQYRTEYKGSGTQFRVKTRRAQ